MPAKKLEFYNNNHLAWRPTPSIAIPIEEGDEAVEATPSVTVAKPSKAEEAEQAEQRRKIKQERIEKNRKEIEVYNLKPFDDSAQLHRPTAVEPKPKSQRTEPILNLIVFKASQAKEKMLRPPLSSSGNIPPPPPSPKAEGPGPNVEGSEPTPIKMIFPRTSVEDAPPFVPKILVLSLEFPSGHLFTIKDSAFNFPKEFTKGVAPSSDQQKMSHMRHDDFTSSLY